MSHPSCQVFLDIEKYFFITEGPLENILTRHCLWCIHCNSKTRLPSIALEADPGNYFMKVYLLVVGIAVLQFTPQQFFCVLPLMKTDFKQVSLIKSINLFI